MSTNSSESEPIQSYSQIKPKLKTGDIILFSCKSHGSLIESLAYYARTSLLGSEYGHVGIVYRDDNTIYLLECTHANHIAGKGCCYLNNFGKGGVRVVELDNMIATYQKQYQGTFALLPIAEPIPNDFMIDVLSDYRNSIFESKTKLFMLAFIDIVISHKLAKKLEINDTSRLMCSEFVCRVLQRSGKLAPYPAKLFWPFLFTNSQLGSATFPTKIKFCS